MLLLPFKFTIDSLIILFKAPGQLFAIAKNESLRKNHALEHATVNILEKKYGYSNLSGLAEENGFYINGVINPKDVKVAAQEGLLRLQQGERNLVVHKQCGTSLTVANLVSAVVFILLLLLTGVFSLLNMLLAIIIANFIGPQLGVWVQKNYTTSYQVDNMEINGVQLRQDSQTMLGINVPKKVFVRTSELVWK
ncbi:sRNA-binding carbon storage regulator CsrA [Halanaerobacter jeridensis]|uniref:SRNA-binding carbon storage regulator CsrA n=1 Tax=Halanaerobacter jeridensis TaxID=706427 RepID=A0A938XQB6_9FIRM|nr:sRNA-binding carbon storage regulator CsrA [Halanaerobacter jeridensis]